MSKNTDTVIRSLDASVIYYKSRPENQIQKYLSMKDAYIRQKKIAESLKDDDPDKKNQILEKEKLKKEYIDYMNDILMTMTQENDFKLPKCSSKTTEGTSNMSLSLMRMELQGILKKKDKFTRDEKCSYSDVCINVTFNSDVFGMTDKYIRDKNGKWIKHGKIKTSVIDSSKLRKLIYKNGFWMNGRHYVDYQRSGAKSRIGNDLFIMEEYCEHMTDWMNLGLDFNIPKEYKTKKPDPSDIKYEKVDLVSVRSYQSLASSSIIGTVNIDPESILLVDDVEGTYTMECNVVRSKPYVNEDGKSSKHLEACKENYTQYTDCFDGQSLVDESVFNENIFYHRNKNGVTKESYKKKGFLLLRNRYFKSAGFNTKIQEFFQSDEARKYLKKSTDKDGNIYYMAQDRFGDKFDTRDIKIITTKNSVKIFKEPFKSAIIRGQLGYSKKTMMNLSSKECDHLIWKWYKKAVSPVFGICKYEKESKFNGGDYQQMAYQIDNSLNFSYGDMQKMCSPMLHHMTLLKNHPAFMREYLHSTKSYREAMMSELLAVNNDISYTKMYDDFLKTQLQSIRKKLYQGKALIENADYAIMVGNPYEMLLLAAGGLKTKSAADASGKKHLIAESIMNNDGHDSNRQFEVYCKKFGDGKELYGFRNPHICEANAAYLINTWHDEYKWFNFTENIIAVSFTGYGAFLSPVLNGADTDSDSILVGDNKLILSKVIQAKKDSDKLIPINEIEQEPVNRLLTEESLAEIDSKLSNDYIGRIVNLAQVIQSCYWHIYNSGTDTQKKQLRTIYDDLCILEVLSNVAIDNAKRRYAVSIKKELNRIQHRAYLTQTGAVIEGTAIAETVKVPKPSISQAAKLRLEDYEEKLADRDLSEEQKEELETKIDRIVYKSMYIVKKPVFMSKLKSRSKQRINREAEGIEQTEQEQYKENDRIRQDNSYIHFDTPMDFMHDIISKFRVTSADKAKGRKTVDIIDVLKPLEKGQKAQKYVIDSIVKWTLEFMKQEQAARMNAKSKEDADSRLNVISDNAVNKFKKYKVTESEIITLIKKCYDDHIKSRSQESVHKIDERLAGHKAKAKMLGWLYEAHREKFLSVFKHSIYGEYEYLKEVPEDYIQGMNEDIYELYNKRYIIIKKTAADIKKAV